MDDDVTAGYYIVHSGCWHAYADPGEAYLCDACMWADPRYIATHGLIAAD